MPIPPSLHHDDFHDGNIAWDGRQPRFFDWGECALAHPFFSMVVGLRAIAWRFELEPESQDLLRLRDAYLEPWQCFAGSKELLETFDLAQRVGRVNRAITWYQVLKHLTPSESKEDQPAVAGWLQVYLEGENRIHSV
jgi:aminoglycoside phosphotransferase (APT) family kinase protein